MGFLSNSIFLILIWISAVSLTTAHYCVWGLCEPQQSCCGENVCCSPPDYNIWITVAIIAGVAIGMVLAGTCLYYNIQYIYTYLRQKYYNANRVTMPSEFESDVRSIKISYQE